MNGSYLWKHSILDVYANNYGAVLQDYLWLVVEPSLGALRKRGEELMRLPDDALFSRVFQLGDHRVLEQKAAMAFCLGIQSLWEQQIRTYMTGCVRHHFFTPDMPDDQRSLVFKKEQELAEKVPWGSDFNNLFFRMRGLKLECFESYGHLDFLMLLGNVCRHGEGKAARKLRQNHPELWPERLTITEDLFGPRSVAEIKLTFEMLRSLVESVVLFWRDLERYGLLTIMGGDVVESCLSNRIREY